ncbi:MAG: hypothetical protein IJP41_11265 [Synergistaceae bacterium]|nr:hypothetical protein [Synergistaceae bacterium]
MSDELKLIDVKDIAAETAKRLEPDQDQTEQAEEANKSKPEFLAYKSIFTPSRGDIGGGFCVIFEGKSGKTVFQVFWLAKPYHSGVMIEPSKDWRTFVKRLPQLGPLDKDWGEQLQEQLKTILTTDEKRKLFENYTKVKLRQIESIIRRNFENVTQCVFSASTDAEPVARPELERAKVIKPLPPSREELERQQREKEFQERQEQEEREKEEAKKEGNFEGTIIMCTPLVDPVKGKASSEIAPGDIIGVGIEGEGTSALVKKYLEENNIEPLFPVHEIRETEGKKFFYVKISDEIRGCITITKDIKIKVKGSAKESENQAANLSFFGDVLFFGVLAGALVALLFLIRYFFL